MREQDMREQDNAKAPGNKTLRKHEKTRQKERPGGNKCLNRGITALSCTCTIFMVDFIQTFSFFPWMEMCVCDCVKIL